ncbi:MAG TPA: STAS domain-containing protein [Solirubrobacterales bacterium]|nr:STAS domain-containing protein [Solirubrobacterales bacterium]
MDADGQLLIRSLPSNGGTTLTLTGVLDFASAETLTVEIAKAPIDDGAALTIDLTEVEFIDSTGIALLVSVFRHFNAEDRGFKLIPSRADAVRRVMEVTGLDRTFPFSDGA